MNPPTGGTFRLADVRVPAAVSDGMGVADAEGFVRCDLGVADGVLAAAPSIAPSVAPPDAPSVAMGGAIVLPGFVDCHTHLDKGHVWARAPNPDGSFAAALSAVGEDRDARWSFEDVRARMEFALRSAHAHGTIAIRTHVDTGDHRTESSWAAVADARDAWAGRIALDAAALTTLEDVFTPRFAGIADLVAAHRGALGAVTYPMEALDARLDRILTLAAERGMDADFHADESLDPASDTLGRIADAVIRTGFPGRVLCGHCCALAAMAEADALRIIDRVAEAGLHVVSLPMCNMYLQDRAPGRTPRLRGVTLVHEMRARGVPVAFASDNTRDPFYAHGDLDMLEVWREATRIAHLDHPVGAWPAAFGRIPAAALGIEAGVIRPGAAADLVVFPAARGWTELLSRPHPDRIVLRAGRRISAAPAPYADLDPFMAVRP